MTRWFRWYQGSCEDGKIRVVARNGGVTVRDVIAVWAFVLEDAAHDRHRGTCERNADFISAVLDFEKEECTKILDGMQELGMILLENGNIKICNWKSRQYETDQRDGTNAVRQKRFRDRMKRDSNGNVTVAKLPETDTDTEKKERKKRAASASPPAQVPASPEKELFDRGKKILGGRAGGLIANLLRARDGDVALARAVIETASTKQDPREYVGAVIRNLSPSTYVDGRL